MYKCHEPQESWGLSTPFYTPMVNALRPKRINSSTWSFIMETKGITTKAQAGLVSTSLSVHMAAIEKLSSSRNQSVEFRKHSASMPQFPGIASAHVSNQRYDENVAKNCSKLLQIPHQLTVHCTRKPLLTVSARIMLILIQAVVKICQLFISELSTVINSTNQILIPGAGIMERRHQWNVYRLPCALPPHQTALGSSHSP